MLHVRFRGVLNDQLRGFYRSTFKDDSRQRQGHRHVTQFEATSARRAFPCWDEPDLKAVFSITLVVDGELTALANTKQISDERTGDGRRPRPVRRHDAAVDLPGRLHRRRARAHRADRRRRRAAARRAPARQERAHRLRGGVRRLCARASSPTTTASPIPTDKLDLVALPDFAAGAMENLGCVTFREALLLVDPATATQAEELVIANVVAHEIAHMWFGDLVTMRWWNGIWLNEAFATFMAQVCIDALKPEWHVWDTFGLDRTAALETDALESTRPIEYPVALAARRRGHVRRPDLREGRRCPAHARAVPRRRRVPCGRRARTCRSTRTGTPRPPICGTRSRPRRASRRAASWMPGSSRAATRSCASHPAPTAARLRLTQRRFVYSDIADATQWPVPLHIRQSAGGETTNTRLLLDSEHDDISLAAPDAVVLVNAGGHGFLRVRYEAPFLDRLAGPALAEMSTIERYNLVDDAWAAVVAGEASATEYLHLARGFGDESTLPVWQALSAGLGFCDRLIDDPEAREQFRTFVRGLAGPALHRLGWAPRDGEDDLTGELRGLLIRTVAILGDDRDAQAKARALYQQSLDDPASVAPPVASASVDGLRCRRATRLTTTMCSTCSGRRRTRRNSCDTCGPLPTSTRPSSWTALASSRSPTRSAARTRRSSSLDACATATTASRRGASWPATGRRSTSDSHRRASSAWSTAFAC